MIDARKCLDVVNMLEAIPSEMAGKMSVSDLLAVARLGFVTRTDGSQPYRPMVDAARLCRLSKGTHRLVKLNAAPDRSLEGFTLTKEGEAFVAAMAGPSDASASV